MNAKRGRCRIPLLGAVVLVLFAAAAAEDVLLLLPKNFDVRAHKGWSWNKQEGRKELTAYQSSQTVLQFRGSRVTAGGVWTYRYPCKGGGVFINKVKTEIVATYDKGHLSGTYESQMRNWNEGCAASNDAEFLQLYNKGTVSGEAGSDGILKIKVEITKETILNRESTWQKTGEGKGAITKVIYGGGWKKRDREFNLFSWGAEFKLPVGELHSSQVLSEQKKDDGEPGAGESEPGDAGAADDAAAAVTEEDVPEFTPAELAAASRWPAARPWSARCCCWAMSGVGRGGGGRGHPRPAARAKTRRSLRRLERQV